MAVNIQEHALFFKTEDKSYIEVFAERNSQPRMLWCQHLYLAFFRQHV
jgi:hypothetical protein